MANTIFWIYLKKLFFRDKTFLFFKIESRNFQVQFEIEFHETLQNFNSIRQPIKKDENNNCLNKLNELKFCEVSRNSILNWTWKFQLSILKNKKVLFLKKIYFWPLSISKQKSFVYWLNFLEGFGLHVQRILLWLLSSRDCWKSCMIRFIGRFNSISQNLKIHTYIF